MLPTEVLKHEHDIILLVLGAVERDAIASQDSGKVKTQFVQQVVDFIRNFADGCHHTKEEKHLFVKMQERGLPAQGGPIAVMLQEHDEGRRLVGAVADSLAPAGQGDRQAVAAVNQNLLDYVQLLRKHIVKENNVLFPLADQILTAQDQQVLAAEFDRVEAEEMGEGVHERYHQWAHDLAA